MDLRPSLTPPRIDTAIVPRLAALVKEIDLLPDGEAAAQIAGAWDEGREIGEYDPSAEQIAEWLFAVRLWPEG
ncbi:hypothetical protein [Microbacterium sp. Bi128]|uniref:hypothetical protein n=1 Tax=Microbacterium sp. Bi128 TaxID=2821115 RepID=UPI001D30B1FC|nr:hypothetical protein [Microbacterium sp. Bi128]CAH0161009.1 hypothetical protein SRABI128_00786 [Microbacterium sp. Bi128]